MKKKIIRLLFLAVLIVALAGIYLSPRARWRAELCVTKTLGVLPGVTWSDLAATTLPRRVASRLDLPALSVTAAERGEAPCAALYKTRLGSFWGRSGDSMSLQIGLKNLLVEEVYFRDRLAIYPGDVVIDGGSHLGTFTRYAVDRKASLVIAFEPDTINDACFRKTFAREIRDGRVILVPEALWEKEGRITFSEGGSSADGKVREPGADSVGKPGDTELSATTIDETVRRLNLARVDFIKLHVEGSERQALRGAKSTLMHFRPRILVALDHRPDDPEVIPGMIRGMVPGYQFKVRGRDQACFFMK